MAPVATLLHNRWQQRMLLRSPLFETFRQHALHVYRIYCQAV